MKESDIRNDENLDLSAHYKKVDQERILRNKENFVAVACPACSGTNKEKAWEKGGFNFDRCLRCETVYVNPRPTEEMLYDHYVNSEEDKYWTEAVYKQSEDNRRKNIFFPRAKRVVELCEKGNVTTETLMDIGAGYGTFASEIKNLGQFKKVIAIEPNPELAQTCREKGIHVIEDFIENVSGELADVATSFESIEHLFDPTKFVEQIYKALKPGGLFILTTPSIKGFDLLLLKEKSENVCAPAHINYFNAQSLEMLLSSKGFKVLETLTPGKLDAELVHKKVASGEYDVSNSPFLKMLLIDNWERLGSPLQDFIADNGLSSHLWVIATKP